MARSELRLTGSGGQGIILAAIILAEAAVIAEKKTAQSQAYGPEARGGMCKAEVIISDVPIGFTKVLHPTFLMALTQEALNHFSEEVAETCMILADAGLTIPVWAEKQTVTAPILKAAKERIGKTVTANIIAVGVINKLLGIADEKTMERAVLRHIPEGTEDLNLKALHVGEEMGEVLKKQRKDM
ncbi:2-oxoacid:acceptor oxidoreductase family protein [Lacrimispora sp. NSJ-141]|uniref:2-oxoacid:acceptor oxidoreductase family protein n=1 Tax=Lientehia hominis TaxID=2897778 RepID=A0AAP2RHR7_9FIRM|nr:2-oxoacid:acceptor oxidoreductase family protein [Lientehia hominis]MCD2492166.1 2-oxoacid:acceptor oxidoreductase family protein [Lientehia hominis]